MTAKKQSLLKKGVILQVRRAGSGPRSCLSPWAGGTNATARSLTAFTPSPSPQDKPDIESLLSDENVNRDALLSYAKEAANFSTNYRLPELEFALNHRALPDVDMFDFTCMTRSENAALVREHNGARLLLGLVGDCLVEVRAVPRFPLSQQGLPDAFIAACSPSPSASRPGCPPHLVPHGHAPQ